jgi:hypothetical protein
VIRVSLSLMQSGRTGASVAAGRFVEAGKFVATRQFVAPGQLVAVHVGEGGPREA